MANFTVNSIYADDFKVEGDLDWLKTFLEDISYNGLDPEKLMATFLAKANASGLKRDQVMRDVAKIILFYVKRGTSFERSDFVQRTVKDAAATEIKTLMSRYGITQNLKNRSQGSENLTVARMVILFPQIAAAAYHVGLATPIATNDSLPARFSFPSAPTLMTKEEWETYQKPFLKAMVNWTRIINKDGTVPGIGSGDAVTDEKIMNQQRTYALNAQQSQFKKDNEKRMIAQYDSWVKVFKAQIDAKGIEVRKA